MLFCCLLVNPLSGQQQKANVRMIADARDGEIRLRWAPIDLKNWEIGNQYGYRLWRTDQANGQEIILSENLLPAPVEAWKPVVDTIPYAGLYAAALYDEDSWTAKLSDGATGTPEDQKNIDKSRFGLALLSADQFWEVSLLAGLGYADKNIKPDGQYIYHLSLLPLSTNDGNQISVSVDAEYRVNLPKPASLEAEWENGEVKLSLDQALTTAFYTTYSVEKAIGDGPFFQVNTAPLVYFEREGYNDPNLYFTDSLLNNTTIHHYRFVGRSPFGIDGPPSDTVSGYGVPPPIPYYARIEELRPGPEGTDPPTAYLAWSVPEVAEDQIVGFNVYATLGGPNDSLFLINPALLLAQRRTYTITDPVPNYNYLVSIVDVNGNRVDGVSKLLRIYDKEPPVPPVGLTGTIDSNGVVNLKWPRNLDNDLSGYRVYRTNGREGEPIEITRDVVHAEQYQDTITMNTLSDTAYYAIRAIDFTGNYSDFSQLAALSRPDLNPPIPPVIKAISGSTEGVRIEWTGSASQDAVTFQLQRKVTTDTSFQSIADFPARPAEYLDSTTARGQSYHYRLLAIDDAGLSAPGRPATAIHLDNGVRAPILEFTARRQTESGAIKLNWQCASARKPSFFQILRSENGGPLQTIRNLKFDDPGLIKSTGKRYAFQDRAVKPRATYVYRIVGRFLGGAFTPMSPEVRVD
ncbi:hypothetical protein CEQ90_13385 [Lewinellaceae bacterium SD302]|nr:hypothetical protein CEQ90_13385 [Lewinellaceae bacterium SD302]